MAFFLFFFGLATAYSQQPAAVNDPQAYILYRQGNERYRVKRYDEARQFYLDLVNQYPRSRYVPYSIYMLSFMETDYVKIIDYLGLIKDKYTDFRYWTNAVEKLGDVFYVMGNHGAAMEQYRAVPTERSVYMLAMIAASDNKPEQALPLADQLLSRTKDHSLAYKAQLIRIKILLDQRRFDELFPALQESLKLKKWAYDNCARALYYTGRYYFERRNIVEHREKALYVFSLVKTVFPLSVEATMANSYLDTLRKADVSRTVSVRWVADVFAQKTDAPYKQQTVPVLNEMEQKAESVTEDAEGLAANMVRADVLEYVVRIGEYKDLSVANLVARDVLKTGQTYPLGIYFRNDLYFAEIRGVKTLEEAKSFAAKLKAMGYADTRVVEFVRVVEYAR